LNHTCKGIPQDRLHLPGPDFIDRIWMNSDRNNRLLGNLQRSRSNGRLGGTGYVSILPVDQGSEHAAGASCAKPCDGTAKTASASRTRARRKWGAKRIMAVALQDRWNRDQRNLRASGILPIGGAATGRSDVPGAILSGRAEPEARVCVARGGPVACSRRHAGRCAQPCVAVPGSATSLRRFTVHVVQC